VVHNTPTKQPDTIAAQRMKLRSNSGCIDVDSVEELLADAVADGEFEKTEDGYRVHE